MRTQRLSGVVFIVFILVVISHAVVPAGAAEHSFTKPTPYATAIACMKFLPDGAPVCIHNKSITGITNTDVYIAEPDRSSGIRISTAGTGIPGEVVPGALICCTGVMATENGDRFITNTKNITFTATSGVRIPTLAMASPAIMGWPIVPKNPTGPRVGGLLPTNLLVSIWGKVTAKAMTDGDGLWFIYLDDGWGKKDGSDIDCAGIRVYCDNVPADDEPFQMAVGVLALKQVDPTPFGPDGDEIVIPTIRTTFADDVYPPHTQPVLQPKVSVTGRVRLVGQGSPGIPVRLYSDSGDVVIDDVTDTFTDFTFDNIKVDGSVVTASAPGYLSETVNVYGGSTGIDIALHPSDMYVEVIPVTSSIAVCSDDSAPIHAVCRDCEGKGISGRQIKMTTTLGVFAESQTKHLIVSTDASGYAEGHLLPGTDGAGVAFISICDYPGETKTAYTEIQLIGPQLALTASQYYLDRPGYSNISASVTSNGNAVVGETIAFRTTIGTFIQTNQQTAVAVTDEFGRAQVTLSLRTAGTALVTASYSNHCSQRTVNWLAVSYGTAPWYNQGVNYSHPLVTDLDGLPDGKKEVVFITSGGALVALNSSGSPLWTVSLHPGGNNTAACSNLDSLRSGRPAIFVPTESQQKIYAFTNEGRPLAGWPAGTDYVVKKASVAIGDINLDGTNEIVTGDECCYVFSWNPTGDWKATGTANSSYLWRNLTGTSNTAIFGSSCAIGDLNGDPSGILDVAIGTNHGPEAYAFPGDAWGDFVYKPYYLSGWPRATGGRVESSPALGDIDGDGRNDFAVGCDTQAVFVWLSGDNSWKSYATDGMVRSSPALCDLDDDGKLDIVVGTYNGRVYALNWRGQAVAGWSNGILLNSTGTYPIESSPVIGDINGDGQVEVVIGCNDGNIYALYKDARNHMVNGELTGPIAWVGCCIPPGTASAQVLTAPVIDDVDNDGKVDIVAAGNKGVYIHRLDAVYSGDPALYPWPTFHRDNQRTGCATEPPAPVNASIQGIVTRSGVPISRAKIHVYKNDGSPVYQPYSDPPAPRDFVYSVGGSDPNEGAKGAYCISQLEPNKTYKLKVELSDASVYWVNDIAVTTGLVRVDIEL